MKNVSAIGRNKPNSKQMDWCIICGRQQNVKIIFIVVNFTGTINNTVNCQYLCTISLNYVNNVFNQ